MDSINMIREVIDDKSLRGLLENTFGSVGKYKINYTLAENSKIRYINLEAHILDDISDNINMMSLARNLFKIYESCTQSLAYSYSGPFRMKITSEYEYSNEDVSLENLSGSYDDDDWYDDDCPEYLGTSFISSENQTFLIDISKDYGELLLDISISETDSPIQSNIDVEVNLEYDKNGKLNLSVEYDNKQVKLLTKAVKLQLSNLIKELNSIAGLQLEEIKIDAEEMSYTNLIADLKELTNKETTDKLFCNMVKDAIVTDFEVTMFIGEDGDCRVRYFTEGYGFSWNYLNWDDIPEYVNINVESQMLDRVDRNFWSRKFKNEISYHSNDIIDGKINDYSEAIKSKLVGIVKNEDCKHMIDNATFSLTLNKGTIYEIKDDGQYLYGVNHKNEVLFVSRDSKVYNQKKLKNLMNKIIMDVNLEINSEDRQ